MRINGYQLKMDNIFFIKERGPKKGKNEN